MAKWIRFEQNGSSGFGTLEGNIITVHTGDMFAGAKPSGETLKLSEVQIQTPCEPSKMICLWNNFHQLAAKNDFTEPTEPLWFLKAPNAYRPAGEPIQRPATYAGKIIYEGELGVVIGKKCFNISEAEAGDYIFGYTCVNDVTAVDLLQQGPDVRSMGARQELRHVRRVRPRDRDRPRPDEAVGHDHPQRQGAAELSGRRHVLPAAQAGRRGLEGHDADAGRHHRLRHLARRRRHGATPRNVGRHRDRRRRHARAIVFDQELPSPYLSGAPPKPKRICVVGAGAIGGLMAAKFALAGEEVTVIDQGAHLAAIQKNGLKLEWHDGKVADRQGEGRRQGRRTPASRISSCWPSRRISSIRSCAISTHLLGPDTIVLTVQNGLPWWYFQKLGGKYDDQQLRQPRSVGRPDQEDRPDRLIGCVVYPAAAVTAPGVIHHVEGDRFPIGELDGKETERVKVLHDVLRQGRAEVARAQRTSAPRSGSRHGATCRSTRSAR